MCNTCQKDVIEHTLSLHQEVIQVGNTLDSFGLENCLRCGKQNYANMSSCHAEGKSHKLIVVGLYCKSEKALVGHAHWDLEVSLHDVHQGDKLCLLHNRKSLSSWTPF